MVSRQREWEEGTVHVEHIAVLYFSVIWAVKYDDQHRNPNIIDKDHLVRQLTRSRWETAKQHPDGHLHDAEDF